MANRRWTESRLIKLCTVCIIVFAACAPTVPPPELALGDPGLSETQLRTLLGIPPDAERVLILSQSSHLDINWKRTHEQYYTESVDQIFEDATRLLADDPRYFYSIAEMGFLSKHVAKHGNEPWRPHIASGHARIVGGAMTTPDTLLTTAETLSRDYLYGTLFAERELGARPRAAWLPDSFGHSPTVPDILSAAGYTSVGFGRADGARHSYEVIAGGLEQVVPGVVSTASILRELGSADFVWRGPGGGEVLAHYMPTREYCQGDAIDLDGYVLGGGRLGTERSDDPGFVRNQIAGFIAELTPYQKTPYLFVPVGCDFAPPRPLLPEYARWWNERNYKLSGVWVVAATFEDYMQLVSHHRHVLPVMERDINPVWTGFYASRQRIKRTARVAAESLAGVEPFLDFLGVVGTLEEAWHSVVLSNHHDWITGTSNDTVTRDEQIPQLEAAADVAEKAWADVLAQLATRVTAESDGDIGRSVVVVNSGPVDRGAAVEVTATGLVGDSFHATADGEVFPVQRSASGGLVIHAAQVPAFGWRTFSIRTGSVPGATASLSSDEATLSTGKLDARLKRGTDGWSLDSLKVGEQELLAGASLEWVVYSDSGGLYRIGSERPECRDAEFVEARVVRPTSLELVEHGPARVMLRGTAIIDGLPMQIELTAGAGDERLTLKVTGSAAIDRTVSLRVRPSAPANELVMGVAGGVARRALSHVYTPSLWPAVSWVARGNLAVQLGQSTAVFSTGSDSLEWVAFRNAEKEFVCDRVGPSGEEHEVLTVEYSLGAHALLGDGLLETAASMGLSRPLRAVVSQAVGGELPAVGRLVTVESASVLATALKRAHRGEGRVLHLQRFGKDEASVRIHPGLLQWTSVSQPDVLERDDKAIGTMTEAGFEGAVDSAFSALRLQ